MPGIDVAPGTVVVYGDIACPWAHLGTYRLIETRRKMGLTDEVIIDMRAFPLELVNQRPTPRKTLTAEVAVVGALDPDAGWQMWQGGDHEWPVTSLPALEAVQAAKLQGPKAAETLDRSLRLALFAQSRCISMRHVILDVATECGEVDVDALRAELDAGTARRTVIEQWQHQREGWVDVSPHVFLPDGSDHPNPGIEVHSEGEEGRDFPVVHSDDPSVYEQIVEKAAAR